jgi:hypothetical protein
MRAIETDSLSMSESLKQANLTQEEIACAEKLVIHALSYRGLGYFGYEDRSVLAILDANFRLLQQARGRKSKGAVKERAELRRFRVNILLDAVDEKYRKDPTSLATVMEIIDWLYGLGDEASEPQVRRSIHAALKLSPLSTD